MDPQQQFPPPPSQQLPQFLMVAPPAPPPQPAAADPLPPIHFAQVANTTPNLAPIPVPNHPPYAQMITEAITALNDRNGSSKTAIAKYIERVYSNSNLPSTHSALLTHHLKRLKEQGNIVMVKHSYKLAKSPAGPPPANANGPKRGRGRPPKAKTVVPSPLQGAPLDIVPVAPVPVPGPIPFSVSVSESVFASLGLVDPLPVPAPMSVSVTKKKPGPPRKSEAGGAGGQPKSTLGKRGRGRPPKDASKNAGPAGSVVGSPRVQPKLKADGTPSKPRGRPPKKNVQNPAPVGVAAAAIGVPVPTVYVGDGALQAVPAPVVKRRGRPAKAQNGPKVPRKLSGKPLGRPKKIAPSAVVQGPNMQQLMAFNEMRSKLDFFQSRIRHTVSVLKPCLDSTTAASALDALSELEELANLEIGPPVTVQGQQPPPQN